MLSCPEASHSSPRKHAPLSALKCHKIEEAEAVQGPAQHCCLRSALNEESRHVAASRCSEHCTFPPLALSARLVVLRREHGGLGTVSCQISSWVLLLTNMGCSRPIQCRRVRGFGFVEFIDERDAEDAERHFDGTVIGGRTITVHTEH